MNSSVTKPPAQRRIIARLIPVATGAVILGQTAGAAARLHWSLDLFSHFQVQFLILLLVTSITAAACRSWKTLVVAAIAAGWSVSAIVPLWTDSSGHTTEPHTLRVSTINVYAANRQFESVGRFLTGEQPDIVVVQEVTAEWADVLRSQYPLPHSRFVPREDAFGIAVMSRYPMETDIIVVEDVPWIVARVSTPQGIVSLIAVHTLPPVGSANAARRNAQLKRLARLSNSATTPVVIAGDLNCSPWSPYFHDLISEASLISTRRGFGVLPSWPLNRFPMRIPIDHILIGPEFRVSGLRIGPSTGSDHLPVTADLRLFTRREVKP